MSLKLMTFGVVAGIADLWISLYFMNLYRHEEWIYKAISGTAMFIAMACILSVFVGFIGLLIDKK
jgi:uncharacterized membrane protein YcjF (UPF0283 family)